MSAIVGDKRPHFAWQRIDTSTREQATLCLLRHEHLCGGVGGDDASSFGAGAGYGDAYVDADAYTGTLMALSKLGGLGGGASGGRSLPMLAGGTTGQDDIGEYCVTERDQNGETECTDPT